MSQKKIIDVEDIQNLRLDDRIKEELYDLKETAEQAGALKHLLNSEGWDELKKAVLDDAQTAIFNVIKYWKEGETVLLDRSIARLEQILTMYTTIEGSGRDANEAEELLANRVQDIVSGMS